ncbi:Fe-S oxidoreductase [Cryobacterium algoritolerans]|uniref:Fe-S oxidoreductase n=1 Tax=Cryobacterium algoritolerans TaxID=1259184 RepID=A0A4R8WWE0_9MICO|nr:Fe-S oxidoreductase [Cryobacterium algoritolerans]TFC19584.1 Fe-S oxidoreductase [Cryobacterium algoritolerans]
MQLRVGAAAYAGDVRRLLFDSPLSRAGYLYATLVGLVWGSIWSTGRVEHRGGLVIFRGMPAWAFGRGGSCVGGCYLTNQNVTDRILEHEAVHKRQWQQFGMVFPLLYLVAGRNPLRNRFEIEAGLDKGGYLAKGEHR